MTTDDMPPGDDPSGPEDLRQISASLWAPATHSTGPLDTPPGLKVTLGLTLRGSRYAVTRFDVVAGRPDLEVTGELLRQIAIGQLRAAADVPQLYVLTEGGNFAPYRVRSTEELAAIWAEGSPMMRFRLVEQIYVWGAVIGAAQAKLVELLLPISPSTAGYWIRRTKDKGLIFDDDAEA